MSPPSASIHSPGANSGASSTAWCATRGCRCCSAPSYLDEAARCDHVVVLHQGKVLSEGAPSNVIELAEGRTFTIKPQKVRPHANCRRACWPNQAWSTLLRKRVSFEWCVAREMRARLREFDPSPTPGPV